MTGPTRRAIPGLVAVLVGMAAIVIVGRDEPVPAAPVFSVSAGTWMPAVFDADALTGTWFCPGVPASGSEGVGGEVIVGNRLDRTLAGQFTILTPEGEPQTQPFEVGPWSRSVIDVDAFVAAPFASVVVEIEGGGGVVEQRAGDPLGTSIAPCSNDTSSAWYFADGFTVDGSSQTLVLTNPYDDAVIADLRFATVNGPVEPALFQGFPIPPNSVKVIPIADLGARDEPVIAVEVVATSGRLVVGREQRWTGGDRSGYSMTLGAPAIGGQFWFADGEKGADISETYAIYNPTPDDVEVDVVFLGLPIEANFGNVDPIAVPAREVVVFDVADVAIPDGRHAVVFSTLESDSIVVERVMTRGDATTVLLGAPPRSDGYVATTWHVGVGPSQPTEDALVVYNIDQADGTIDVSSIGPAGPVDVPGLSDIPLPAGGVITIDLTDPDVLDRELVVDSSNRVFVERSFSRGGELAGRSGSWALPAATS